MRDLLPPAAAARRALGRRLIETMARHGYELVTTPAFEREEVLELGLASVGGADVIRFVEPDTGEVAALRPDMTPQIARIVATRLRDRPAPWRLAYEGTVVRRRRGRARRHRQIAQAGFELIGVAGARGDAEVVRVAVEAARAAGLDRMHVELGHVGITATALASIADDDARAEVADALGRKDVAEVESLARAAG
ncbi:MAG: ATP phosphoribosyltransferase regulatory subunit, partial [Deltaproteobacteria bacterium]|nr:ATP phosphoribosyltransferase regulatory subunit [Deltaproteobacteria bacterium]